MAISDAQFKQWLKQQSSKLTILAEPRIAIQRSGSPAEDTLYWANRAYRSKSSDAVPYRQYQDVIQGAPTFTRALSLDELGGRGTTSQGNLSLNNTAGNVDYLLNEIIDGRDIPVYAGDLDWPRSDFRLIATGSMVVASGESDDSMSVTLKDRSLLLDVSIIGTAIASGANQGKPLPLLFGQVLNIDLTQYLLDPANLIYGFNSYAQGDFTKVLDVRDAGFSLQGTPTLVDNTAMTANAGTDIITLNGHGFVANDVIYFSGDIFAGLSVMTQYWILPTNLTTNTYMVSRTLGGTPEDITGTTFAGTTTIYKRRFLVDIGSSTIQLASKPSQLTADIRSTGPSGNALLQGTPHIGFQYILDNYTSLTAADRDQASFDAMVAAETAAGIQWGYALLDRTNVMDVLDQIAILTNSWYGWNKDGKLSVGKLDLPNLDSVTPIDTIQKADIIGDPSYGNLEIKFGRIIMDANKNVTVQSSALAAAVSAADANKWSQAYQLRVQTTDNGTSTYNPNWWKYHKTAVDSDPLETSLFGNTLLAQTIVNERTALFQPWIRQFKCKVGLDKYALNPGDPVLVIYPRYGLNAGKNMRVMSVNIDLSSRTVDLVLVRQEDADALRASSYTRPNPPTNVSAVGADQQATVTWVPPLIDGGTSITEYLITSNPGGIQVRGLPNLINGSMAMVIAGLTNQVAYTFTVQATNSIGTSDPSAASNSVTPDFAKQPPQAPIIGTPTPGDSKITIGWTPVLPSGAGAAPILDYTATTTPDNVSIVVPGWYGSYAVFLLATVTVSTPSVAGLNFGTGSFTVEMWTSPNTYAGTSGIFPWAKQGNTWNGAGGAGVDSGWGFGQTFDSNGLTCFINDGTHFASGTITFDAGYKPADILQKATHIAVVVDRTNNVIRAYVNGVLQSGSVSISSVTGSVNNSNALKFGASGASGQYQGLVDEFRIWNVARTAQQIASNMNTRLLGTESNLITYYNFDEGTGSTTADQTANALLGTFSSAPVWAPITVDVTGLVNGRSYTIALKARNSAGFSPYSGQSAAAIPSRAPAAPRNPAASAGNAQAFVSWQAPLDTGGLPITGYTITTIGTGGPGPQTVGAVLATTINSLVNGNAYQFKIKAINATGTGPDSVLSNSVTPSATAGVNPPNAPAAPTGSAGNGTITINWVAPSDGGSAILDYTVQMLVGSTVQQTFSGLGTSSLSLTVNGLTNGQAYTFRVQARNAVGSSAFSANSAALTPSTTPSFGTGYVLQAIAGNGQAQVNFASFNTGGATVTGLVITASPGGASVAYSNPNSGSLFGGNVTITGLTNNVQYTFTVTATNANGSTTSGPSNSVTPKPPAHTVVASDINVTTLTPNRASGTSHAAVSGGVGPFVFSWAFVVDGSGITLSNTSTADCGAVTTTNAIQVRQGTLRVTVTDQGNGNLQVTDDANVYLEVATNR